jgi:hypothetical protein
VSGHPNFPLSCGGGRCLRNPEEMCKCGQPAPSKGAAGSRGTNKVRITVQPLVMLMVLAEAVRWERQLTWDGLCGPTQPSGEKLCQLETAFYREQASHWPSIFSLRACGDDLILFFAESADRLCQFGGANSAPGGCGSGSPAWGSVAPTLGSQ